MMLTFIRLKNFMSFHDVLFDFRAGKDSKRFIAIYGENGSGKSNFVNSINFLKKTIFSLEFNILVDKLVNTIESKEYPEEVLEIIQSLGIKREMEMCRMIDSKEDTLIEVGFITDGHNGSYELSFGESFNYERLYYYTGKQRGTLFEIRQTEDAIDTKFSSKLFLNPQARSDISTEVLKYWGNHTFLSILCHERREKNKKYIKDSYLEYVFDFPDMLTKITFHQNSGRDNGSIIPKSRIIDGILEDLESGRIPREYENSLKRTEKILKDFFTQTYSDVKDIFYEREYEENILQYQLYFKKMIAGKIRAVEISRESAGTRKVLQIIHSLLGVFCHMTVVYDEIDNGIHDLLLKSILTSLADDINGQLIITTHNTMILEEIKPSSAYVIRIDHNGEKEIACLDRFGRIQANNNLRSMYLKGLFGGVPDSGPIDYDEILETLHSGLNDFHSENGGVNES